MLRNLVSFFSLSTFLILLAPSLAQANMQGVILQPSFLYYSWDEKLEGVDDSRLTGTYYDIRLGYTMSSGLYFGGIYSHMNRDSGGSARERTSYGASLGYRNGGYFLLGHLFFSSEYKRGSNDTLKDGKGFQVDFGYLFNVTSAFYAGPQVTYRNISYDSRNTGSGANTTLSDTKHTEILPYFTFAFVF